MGLCNLPGTLNMSYFSTQQLPHSEKEASKGQSGSIYCALCVDCSDSKAYKQNLPCMGHGGGGAQA